MSRSGTAGGGSPPATSSECWVSVPRENKREIAREIGRGKTLIDLHANRNGKRLRKRQRNRGRAEEKERESGSKKQRQLLLMMPNLKSGLRMRGMGMRMGTIAPQHSTRLDSTQLDIQRHTLRLGQARLDPNTDAQMQRYTDYGDGDGDNWPKWWQHCCNSYPVRHLRLMKRADILFIIRIEAITINQS